MARTLWSARASASHSPWLPTASSCPTGFIMFGRVLPGRRRSAALPAPGVVLPAGVLHAVPRASLADILRAALEVDDLGGDVAARSERGHGVPRAAEVDEEALAAGLAAETVGEVVHSVLDVVGDVPDLLDPVLGLLVVGGSGRGGTPDLAEEGVHAGELVVHVLDLAADAADERVLLGKEAAELAQQRAHGALGGADGEFHAFSWPWADYFINKTIKLEGKGKANCVAWAHAPAPLAHLRCEPTAHVRAYASRRPHALPRLLAAYAPPALPAHLPRAPRAVSPSPPAQARRSALTPRELRQPP
ncbi:hypothetical protein PVAP13_8KG312704 [Panicum virgatum]|uniref:Uncharacterized protein n=1 Tax=Panicum virgatum TaxID=38727 RepID=A0A8T0PRY1_PANVG|nr:hypothetical protein PVAP13_8KG312704 [Panicum virgatum]